MSPINPDDEDEDDGSVNGVKPPVYLRDCIAGNNVYLLMPIVSLITFRKSDLDIRFLWKLVALALNFAMVFQGISKISKIVEYRFNSG